MKKYNVIYVDPPWHYQSGRVQDAGRKPDRLEENHYPTMTLEEIKNLDVEGLTDKDCICFMWVTDSHLKEGIEVLESWGFTYKTIGFNWIKKYKSGAFCVNNAPWTLKSWELCLIGIKGKMSKYKTKNNVQGLVFSVRREHSRKPDEVRQSINAMFENCPKLELFARQKTQGWDVWGNEIQSDIAI